MWAIWGCFLGTLTGTVWGAVVSAMFPAVSAGVPMELGPVAGAIVGAGLGAIWGVVSGTVWGALGKWRSVDVCFWAENAPVPGCKNRGVKFGGYNVCAVRVRGTSTNKMVDAIAEINAG